jgi:hypothetical protein
MKSICGACNKVFSSVGAFDMHRTGTYGEPIYEKGRFVGYTPCARYCMSVESMQSKGMIQNEKGWWTTGVEFDTSRFANKEAG